MKTRFSIVKPSFNNLVIIVETKGKVQEAFLFVSFSTEGGPSTEGGNWSSRNLGHKFRSIS